MRLRGLFDAALNRCADRRGEANEAGAEMAKTKDDGKKVALITGASSGVGLHTAIAFAKAGYTTLATMRQPARKTALEKTARDAGVNVIVKKLDAQDPGSISACVKRAIRDYAKIDVLVNNAGAGFLGSIEQTSDADLQRIMGVNFFGVWNATKAVFPHMREAGGGRIITVTSVGGLIGQPFNEAYCAAKFAVEGMMEGFAPLARRMGVSISLIDL
jgi:NAD(P)-dependent dehydrogenase (short-subunit alcohol dehydrogenase family)